MRGVLIENPVLNSPFSEPTRHFVFDEDGITDEVAESRRASSFFIPIAQPKKKGKQLALKTLGHLSEYARTSSSTRCEKRWALGGVREDVDRFVECSDG